MKKIIELEERLERLENNFSDYRWFSEHPKKFKTGDVVDYCQLERSVHVEMNELTIVSIKKEGSYRDMLENYLHRRIYYATQGIPPYCVLEVDERYLTLHKEKVNE